MDNPQAMTVPARPRAGSLQTAAVFAVCVAVSAACSASPAPRPKPLPEPRPRSTASASAANHVLKRGGYLAARREWLDEGSVIGGPDQDLPVERAVTDLEQGEVTDSGNKSEYPAIIAALKVFVNMPDTDVTAAQDAQARADAVKIDKFFHLRGKRSCYGWPSTRKACWEP
jgi:ribonuclease HI